MPAAIRRFLFVPRNFPLYLERISDIKKQTPCADTIFCVGGAKLEALKLQTRAQREDGHLLRVADFEFLTATEVITQRNIGIVGRQDVYADDYVIQELLGNAQTGFTRG